MLDGDKGMKNKAERGSGNGSCKSSSVERSHGRSPKKVCFDLDSMGVNDEPCEHLRGEWFGHQQQQMQRP